MTAYNSNEHEVDARIYPIDKHGKLRFAYFSFTAPSGGLAANDTIKIAELPQGRKRILPSMSRLTTSAFGAGRTLDIGHLAYLSRAPDEDETAADPDAFADGIDVESAIADTKFSSVLKFDMWSMAEVDVNVTVLGDTMPEAATIEGYLVYVCE